MRYGELTWAGALVARARGQGFPLSGNLSGQGLVMKRCSSRAHCLHRMAACGALGDCDSHFGLNSMRKQSGSREAVSRVLA